MIFIKLTDIIEYGLHFNFKKEVFIFAFETDLFFSLFVMVPTAGICV